MKIATIPPLRYHPARHPISHGLDPELKETPRVHRRAPPGVRERASHLARLPRHPPRRPARRGGVGVELGSSSQPTHGGEDVVARLAHRGDARVFRRLFVFSPGHLLERSDGRRFLFRAPAISRRGATPRSRT